MSQNQDNFKRGTAEFLLLYLLRKEDLYGYKITQLFNQKSEGRYTMLEGSLYPILYKLEDAGYITSYTRLVGRKRQRRLYHITETGEAYFERVLNEFDEVNKGVNQILDR